MLTSLKSFLCLDQKFLVWNMVDRTLKLRYRQSILGYFWTLLTPLATAAIYYFLFKIIFKVQIPDFAAFVTTGILVWTFFSGTLNEGMASLVAHFQLLLQVNVPLNLFPFTTAVSSLITLLFALPIILGICLVSGVTLGWPALLFFYYLALLFVQAYCLSYLLSIAVIYVRDLKQALGIILQVWMYGTPILYQSNLIPEKYWWVLYLNPVGKIFTGIHNSLLRSLWPTAAELLFPLAWTLVIFVATLFLHTRVSRSAIERI